MTAETAEAEAPEIQWEEIKVIQREETPGRHRVPGDSTPDTAKDDLTPEDLPPEDVPERVQAAPRHAAPPKRPVGRPRTRAIEGPKEEKKTAPPKISAPNFSEWHEYLSNFAIRWIARAYIAFVFRGIDRYELLSPEDNKALELDDEQLSDIAKPLAHIASRSKFLSKHGRMLIDSSDGVAAGIHFVMWANRVNKIAKKVRPVHEHRVVQGTAETVSEGPAGNGVPGPAWAANGSAPGAGYN